MCIFAINIIINSHWQTASRSVNDDVYMLYITPNASSVFLVYKQESNILAIFMNDSLIRCIMGTNIIIIIIIIINKNESAVQGPGGLLSTPKTPFPLNQNVE